MSSWPTLVRVLVVDDQEVFRQAAKLVIEMAPGFELAASAASGEEAISMTAEIDPDLILMDVHLPGLDGFEATRRLRLAHPRTRIIVFSTHGGPEYANQAAEVGALDFIAKAELGPQALHDVWHRDQEH